MNTSKELLGLTFGSTGFGFDEDGFGLPDGLTIASCQNLYNLKEPKKKKERKTNK